MGESGVAREQIHTKRCHFVLLHVLVLIHKQLPGFSFLFFVRFLLFSPSEASWSLVGLFPSRSELHHPLPVSPTHVFFRRCYQKCVLALRGDPRSGRGWGGRRRRGDKANARISV